MSGSLFSFIDFVSGSAAGVTQVLLGQPFDMVKVRMQTNTTGKLGAVECINKIMKTDGIKGFYKGTLSPLIGVSLCTSIQFASNEIGKRFFRKFNKSENLSLANKIACGILAGFNNNLIVTPVEMIRIQLQVQSSKNPIYTGTFDCAQKVYSGYGIRGIYQGFFASLSRECPGYGAYFGFYEYLMSKAEKKYGNRKNIPKALVAVYGSIGGTSFWLLAYPADVVKSCIQGDNPGNRKYPNIMSAYKKIYREKGFAGFYKGLAPCLSRAPFANSGTFITFEIMQELLNKE